MAGLDVDAHNLAAYQNAFRCRTVHLGAGGRFVPRMRDLAGGLPVAVLSPDGGGVKRALRSSAAAAGAVARRGAQHAHDP